MPGTPEKQIAKAKSTFIGFEDHGLLSVSIEFDYGGGGQSIALRPFGCRDESKDPDAWRRSHEMGMDLIRRLLLVFGVERWEQIPGKTVFVTATWSEIQKIEPLPTEMGLALDLIDWAKSYEVMA